MKEHGSLTRQGHEQVNWLIVTNDTRTSGNGIPYFILTDLEQKLQFNLEVRLQRAENWQTMVCDMQLNAYILTVTEYKGMEIKQNIRVSPKNCSIFKILNEKIDDRRKTNQNRSLWLGGGLFSDFRLIDTFSIAASILRAESGEWHPSGHSNMTPTKHTACLVYTEI